MTSYTETISFHLTVDGYAPELFSRNQLQRMTEEANDPVSALAMAVNAAMDNGDASELARLAEAAQALYETVEHKLARASIAFSKANAHSYIRQLLAKGNPDLSWEWDPAELKREIFWLRKAQVDVSLAKKGSHQRDLRARIETNLGNAISHVGRFCESLDHWDAALKARSGFGMALVCRGDGLSYYSRALYDPGHQRVFLWEARRSLIEGLETGVEAHARPYVKEQLDAIEDLTDWSKVSPPTLDGYPLGRSKAERQYRSWCLRQRLFLNPLNDLGGHEIAARDVLTFPSITQSKDDAIHLVPKVYGIYNQLVQEFVSTRFTVYEALETLRNPDHYSDRDVLLYDSLDYRVMHLWVERLKMAYLAAFAIFDKIAFLLNHHWRLGVDETKISFGTIWFQDREVRRGLRPEFKNAQNWPLRGLFGLSRDLNWKADGDFPAEPEARQLHGIRNHIAHKYLSVHYAMEQLPGPPGTPSPSTLSYRITDDEIAHAAVKVLKLARSALIYVSLAAHRHEQINQTEMPGLVASMSLFPMGDRR